MPCKEKKVLASPKESGPLLNSSEVLHLLAKVFLLEVKAGECELARQHQSWGTTQGTASSQNTHHMVLFA